MIPTSNNGSLKEVLMSTDIALYSSLSQKGLLSDEYPRTENRNKSIIVPRKLGFLNFNHSAKFQQISQFIPSKISWWSFLKIFKKWIKNPLNMALLLWITCVAISGAILFLVMTGMLNSVLSKKSQRDSWFEINNQILNALFTVMCLYQHPKRFHHLILLCIWRTEHISKLREVYCKNGTFKPHERAHMTVVVSLLHVNCFSQYVLCGLNLGYKRSERPAFGVAISLCIAIAAPALAGLYCIIGPLGKDYDLEVDEETPNRIFSDRKENVNSLGKRLLSFASSNEPLKWRGGLFDLQDDIETAYRSLFCSFCIFGWNMERLGFGNMYVHIATFLLFWTAPFLIFSLAANNINNEIVREVFGLTRIVLCVFGLLYGGFWRIQMRKRFDLSGKSCCGGKLDVADCVQWLFCCWCSLAQEVRTVDFYRKRTEDHVLPVMSPLPPRRWSGSIPIRFKFSKLE